MSVSCPWGATHGSDLCCAGLADEDIGKELLRREKQHHAWDTVGIQQTLYLIGKPGISALKWILLLGP